MESGFALCISCHAHSSTGSVVAELVPKALRMVFGLSLIHRFAVTASRKPNACNRTSRLLNSGFPCLESIL